MVKGIITKTLAIIAVSACAMALWGCAGAPVAPPAAAEPPVQQAQEPLTDIVVYASELTASALAEFSFANDPDSPGGKYVMTPNTGDQLDPPPENDPTVTFNVQVQGGVPYRCWIHLRVGLPKGLSKANLVWVQFSNAVNKSSVEFLKPRSGSYLTARGPESEGWTWVGCDLEPNPTESLVYFRSSGQVTVRVQAGMEGVGFDQMVLSPARFIGKPPSVSVVTK